MSPETLDAFEALWNDAALTLDEDAYLALVLFMDPDRSIETALADRAAAAEAVRRASLTDEQRAQEDARLTVMVERGMEIVRNLLDRRRA